MKKLIDKTVFIAGGLSGIGLACAIAAAQEGANIAVADIHSDISHQAFESIQKENPKAINIQCDVSDFNEVKLAIEKVVNTFGSIDVALNNAGVGNTTGKVSQTYKKAWLSVVSENLNGVFYCMYNEAQQMIKQNGGVIINIASILGKTGFAKSSHYVTAQHGIIGLTRTAAQEYASEGIRVIAICPGFVDARLVVEGGIAEHPEIGQQIIDLHPMDRSSKSEEVAESFIFLASDSASYITGTTLETDKPYPA